ncbi:L,D-transpeptidase [Polaromonas sp.]|uniref:L,D-transpeptidase n=1 Tax=Polaromonas sp. TaxID=1869339 RepID=UPI002FCAB967
MDTQIVVSIDQQRLHLYCQGELVRDYLISTARNGVEEQKGSACTPRGAHVIRARIGSRCPVGTVFVGRRPTGEVFSPELAQEYPQRDWILTRILWLSGCEPGRNRCGSVDTLRRYIYIHGCPDGSPMGIPASHGCIRMRNADIVELFDLVAVGTQVPSRRAQLTWRIRAPKARTLVRVT